MRLLPTIIRFICILFVIKIAIKIGLEYFYIYFNGYKVKKRYRIVKEKLSFTDFSNLEYQNIFMDMLLTWRKICTNKIYNIPISNNY